MVSIRTMVEPMSGSRSTGAKGQPEKSLGESQPKPCSECNGTGKLTRLGGDWGKTPESEVVCWACKGAGREGHARKFIGPTNTRGSRYKAYVDDTGPARSITLDGDHRLGLEENHRRAARALIAKLGWFHEEKRGDTYGNWYSGGTREGYVFVCVVDEPLWPEGERK